MHLYLRILLVSFFIALLGLSPAPHAVSSLLQNANQSIEIGDFQNAAINLAAAASYYPWRVDLNKKAAQYALQANDPKSAIQYLERPGTISRLTTDDLIILGDAYNQSGDPFMAQVIWNHVTELVDSIPAYQRLVDYYTQQQDYASAASMMQNLLSLNPSDINLYYQIGLLYSITNPVKALPFLAQAEQIDTSHAQKAKVLYEKIRTANLFDEPAYTLLLVGRQLANWGDWELALAAFQHAVLLRPGYADAWAFLAEARQQIALQEIGAVTDDGLSDLQLALQLDPNSILAHTLMGLYWERQADYSQAQQYLQNAIALSPEDPFLYSELGNILSKAGDIPAAQSAYQAAIQLKPGDPLFYRQLAEFAIQNQIQIHELALPAARQAIMLDPHDAASLDVMAQVMLMLLDYHSAERYSLEALQSDPEFSPACLHLGLAYLYQGKSTLAQQWLGFAESVDPTSWVSAQASRFLDYYFPP
ncbi:MAG: tetratricopeptide repeat protein [Anaerolineales bacterium]